MLATMDIYNVDRVPAWPLPGKSVNMLVREISEKGVKFLQYPRTEKPEKKRYFSIHLEI